MSGSFLPALLLALAVLSLVGLPAPSRTVAAVSRSALPWQRAVPVALPLVLLVLSGPVAAALGLLGCLAVLRARRRRHAASVRQEERAGAAEALAVLSSELRAGRPAALALGASATVAAGPLAQALRAASGSDRVGADPVSCLLRTVEASSVPEVLRGLAACWQVCASTGSSLAVAVERLAESLRSQEVQRLEVEAELAGPRATAGLLAVLPLAGIALAAGLGADPLHVLLHSAVGVGCLMGGIALDALGLWWTGRLVAAAGGVR